MNKLETIIDYGTKINEENEKPTKEEKVEMKISILNILKDFENCFVCNFSFFEWKNKKYDENSDWLLEPLQVFCDNYKENIKKLADKLYEKKYQFVRVRDDIYEKRLVLDIEFIPQVYFQENNKEIKKHSTNIKLFGTDVNTNPFILLPIIYYHYITPRFSYEFWKKDIEFEKNMIHFQYDKEKEKPMIEINKEISKKVYNVLKNEDENDFIMTGNYTLSLLENKKEYNGDYVIFHKEPLSFYKKMNENIEGIKIKTFQCPYYFFNEYNILYLENQKIVTVFPLQYQFNFIRIGYHNHLNFHGLLLYYLLCAIEAPLKSHSLWTTQDYVHLIGKLFYLKNKYIKENKISSELQEKGEKRNFYQILQMETIGTNMTPQLKFNIKGWNKELSGFYRPDKVEKDI